MDVKNLVAGLVVFAAGVGLFIAGLVTKNDAMTVTGTGLFGAALGWLGIKRPVD
jgi:hypothetical protein